nr:hypothetical protein CFP56_63226 [Quercus suber]
MHAEAQPRPSSGVEVREATSIHEAGGDRRRGFEAIARQALGLAASGGRRKKKKKWRRRRGATGLRQSALGRRLGR